MACLIHLTDASREDESEIRALIQSVDPRPGLCVSGKHVEFIIGMVEGNPPYAIDIGPKRLRTFQKVHCLPFADTFKYNFDHLYNEMLVPYFAQHQTGEFGTGHEFAMKGVRFRVIGTEPEGALGVAGASTVVYFEGEPIKRPVLTLAHIVPYKSDLPAHYLSGLMLKEDAILQDYINPYFEQNSHTLREEKTTKAASVTRPGC
eukprot:GEMP01103510.1.p1 GENE.GEMP01103510.1~~GEMP01103510.1.p1  ORF type:complete len:222 (+),score=33.15 GEMP01103510.1:56-667(+)